LLPEESKKDTVAQGEATEAAAPKTTEAIRETLSEKQEPEKISDTLSTLGTPDIPAAKTESKPEPEKAAEKTETKPETKKSATPSGGDSSTYYIQVGVFNMEPTEKFLSKLKNAGLNYIVVKSGKTRRVRVGPYNSLDRANRAISQINKSTGIKGFAVKTGVPKKSEIETTSARKPAVAQAQAKPKKKEKEKEKKREAKKEKSQTTADKKPETKPEEKVTATPKRKVQQKKKPTYVDPLNLFTQKSQYRYYVHVGTFRGNPPASFLKKLRRAGLSYSISKGKTKRSVLVGPYHSYQSAKSAVSKISRKAGIKGRVVKAKR
jgi:cell division protein FtsN